LNKKMQDKGAWVFGGGLHTPDMTTVVRADGGEILTTDGPFPEAKEQIGGFWIIEAKDMDEALDWASQATVACRGPVEVRPFQDEPEG
ncbi:MAG TPA: YciI family protein, partial [Acidimicrobiia bacterium]|nr:YciI family protein [Acidimicrobiia bacterium]